ncbi:hypothetical protein P692DRAFT_201836752 [Suillus brevipes Sb2]|nr:hypothetical protein P692DRAFT_201836752 [Suillus brevipes Sb2]
MTSTLRHLIDDIIIWSQTVKEHKCNVCQVLLAPHNASLFCSLKKTSLFNLEINFLSDVCSFLGLVWYLANHLPTLVDHTHILTPLTTKAAELTFPMWSTDLITSPQCLTTIDHDNPGNNKIFLTCDTSDYCTGAILSWRETWETAQPVAFDSTQL